MYLLFQGKRRSKRLLLHLVFYKMETNDLDQINKTLELWGIVFQHVFYL